MNDIERRNGGQSWQDNDRIGGGGALISTWLHQPQGYLACLLGRANTLAMPRKWMESSWQVLIRTNGALMSGVPDGQTMLVGANSCPVACSLCSSNAFDLTTDGHLMEHLIQFVFFPIVLVVHCQRACSSSECSVWLAQLSHRLACTFTAPNWAVVVVRVCNWFEARVRGVFAFSQVYN